MKALEFAGVELVLLIDGAVWFPSERALIVADLHLEKASSYARHGHFIPPYDSRETLACLARLIAFFAPLRIIALGDSFHDRAAPLRLSGEDRQTLAELTRCLEFLWIIGNHDHKLAETAPGNWGATYDEIIIGNLTFRHEASAPEKNASESADGEISGHYHPKAAIHSRAKRLSGRCFVADEIRLIMPALGTFTGGLCARHPAIARHFRRQYHAHIIGPGKIVTFRADDLVAMG